MNFPNHVKGRARVELGREWGKRSAEKRQPSPLDLETQWWRAKHDRKGRAIREGRDYRADATRHWLIRHSIAGDVDQVDLVLNGRVWRTGALRKAAYAIRYEKWPVR